MKPLRPFRVLAPLLGVTLLACLSFAGPSDRKIIALDFDGTALDTTSVGTADSTGVLDTSRLQQMWLMLKPDKPCKVAIQIRAHGVTDTTGASMSDTTNTYVWPWKSFQVPTIASGAAADTLSLNIPTLPTAVQAGSTELTVYFPSATPGVSKWGGPRGIYIPLVSNDGTWFWARHTSIRLRVLTAYGANSVVTWTATLHGVSF